MEDSRVPKAGTLEPGKARGRGLPGLKKETWGTQHPPFVGGTQYGSFSRDREGVGASVGASMWPLEKATGAGLPSTSSIKALGPVLGLGPAG
jgi:hypothetical protein